MADEEFGEHAENAIIRGNMRLSVQLYTLRDPLSQDLPGTLKKVADTGLQYVEMAGLYDKSAAEWKSMLDELGLKTSGAHVGLDAINGDFEQVVSDAKTLGYNYVIVPWADPAKHEGAWDGLGHALEEAGRKLAAEGLTLAYHNHAFEFKDGGLDALYAATDPQYVKAQLDLAWVQIGGEDPAAYVRKMADRTPLVHLKDFDPDQTPQWRPAGEGVVNWDEVLNACDEIGVQFGSIELDESPGDPIDAVGKSVEYFKARGLS